MGAYVATDLCSVCKTLWSLYKIMFPMRPLGEHLRLEKAPPRPNLHRSSLLSPSRPSKLMRKPHFKRLDLSDTSSTSFVQSVRFCSSSKRGAFKAEAPIGIFDKAPATISNLSLGGHRSQSFDRLSRHINIYFKRKDCVPRAENAYLGSQLHSQSQQAARAQKMSEGKDAMQDLECQDKQESSETSPSTQRYPSLQLFHISSLATTFGEIYTYVANHMNSVFSRHFAKVPMQDDFEMTSAARVSQKRMKRQSTPTTSSKDADESQVKPGAAQAEGKSNPISSSWKEGDCHIARHDNEYFGTKVTDEVAEGRRRTEQHPVVKTSLYRNHLSTQSSSQTQDVPKYEGLFYGSHNDTNYGENYFQMADHVNQYFKVKSGLDEGTDRMELEPGTATSEKTVSFMDYLRHPTSTIPDLFNAYLKLASLTQTGKPKPARTSSEAIFTRTFALSHRQAEEVAQGLIGSVAQASSPEALTACVEAVNEHLISYPSCKAFMWQEKSAVTLLRKRQTHRENQELQRALRETLALIGYVDPVKGHGIRVLSIDGGGTRGVVPLQTLKLLEAETGKNIHQMFDYICGVSSGAVLAFLLGLGHFSLEDCADMFRRLGSEVFQQNRLVGTVKMGWSHSYYNAEPLEAILQEKLGHTLLIKTARDESNPKVSAVSAVVNWGPTPKPFVFRNYNHKPGSLSRYAGGSGFKMWEALRASSAAPGYFQEFTLQSDIHQDGGIILNNPCALAVHESRLLWPNQPFQCVLSLGTGRYDKAKRAHVTSTSLRAKISNLIHSATDTEGVHTLLDDLLAPDVYFRFNPMLSAMVSLDESRPQALDQLQRDTQNYLERNQPKLARLCFVLGAERSAVSRTKDWISERAWVMKQRWV